MTDTGYDPNPLESLKAQTDAAHAYAMFCYFQWDTPVDVHKLTVDEQGDRHVKYQIYQASLKALEDAWRAENDYMKRATK